MEIVIVICLLIIINLLLKNKIITTTLDQKPKQEKINPGLPDIMGQPKPSGSYSGQNRNLSRGAMELENSPVSVNATHDEKIDAETQSQHPARDNVSGTAVNLRDEEEDWVGQGIITDDSFATGVTFDELASVGKILAQKTMGASETATAAGIAAKIDGTELLGLLESRIGDASKKIAMLLDRSITKLPDEGSSLLRDNNQEGFDIGDYV